MSVLPQIIILNILKLKFYLFSLWECVHVHMGMHIPQYTYGAQRITFRN